MANIETIILIQKIRKDRQNAKEVSVDFVYQFNELYVKDLHLVQP